MLIMKVIQVTFDEPLLKRLDRDAEVKRIGRSAVLRRAAEAYLRGKRDRAIAEAYRRGYADQPPTREEVGPWYEDPPWREE